VVTEWKKIFGTAAFWRFPRQNMVYINRSNKILYIVIPPMIFTLVFMY